MERNPVCKQKQTRGELFLEMFHGEMPNRETEMIPNQVLKKLGNGDLEESTEPCQKEW